MDTLLYNNELQLGRFAEYLLKQRLVPEKNAPYYVSWVRKFLARGVTVPVPPRRVLSVDLRTVREGQEPAEERGSRGRSPSNESQMP